MEESTPTAMAKKMEEIVKSNNGNGHDDFRQVAETRENEDDNDVDDDYDIDVDDDGDTLLPSNKNARTSAQRTDNRVIDKLYIQQGTSMVLFGFILSNGSIQAFETGILYKVAQSPIRTDHDAELVTDENPSQKQMTDYQHNSWHDSQGSNEQDEETPGSLPIRFGEEFPNRPSMMTDSETDDHRFDAPNSVSQQPLPALSLPLGEGNIYEHDSNQVHTIPEQQSLKKGPPNVPDPTTLPSIGRSDDTFFTSSFSPPGTPINSSVLFTNQGSSFFSQ